MKKILILLAIFCLGLPSYAAQVLGLWQTLHDNGKPKSVVRVYEENGIVYGKILLTYKTDGKPDLLMDEYGNLVCDESVRAAGMPGKPPLCGLVIIKGMRPGNRGIYNGGTITNPKSGREYRADMRLEGNGDLIVTGRWGIFSRRQTAHPFTEEELAALLNLSGD